MYLQTEHAPAIIIVGIFIIALGTVITAIGRLCDLTNEAIEETNEQNVYEQARLIRKEAQKAASELLSEEENKSARKAIEAAARRSK